MWYVDMSENKTDDSSNDGAEDQRRMSSEIVAIGARMKNAGGVQKVVNDGEYRECGEEEAALTPVLFSYDRLFDAFSARIRL